MGLQFNLIKTCAKTLNRYGTMGANDCIKVVQLGEKSPYKSWNFCEILHGPGGWEIRGENPREFTTFFPNTAKKELQRFIRQHTTGTTVKETADRTIVNYGTQMGHKPFDSSLFGFEKTKDSITYHTTVGDVTFARSSKSKIRDFLENLMGKTNSVGKYTVQEFDKRIAEDFSEEMIKPVHDFLEGKLSKEKLVELIKKYKKNICYNPVISESESALAKLEGIPANYIPKEVLDELGIHSMLRDCTLRSLLSSIGYHGNKQAKILLDEFLKSIKVAPSRRTSVYRYVDQEETDKILAGEIVKSRARYNYGKRFDVTTRPGWDGYHFRVKFNIEANEKTIDRVIVPNKPEFNYYHWNVSEYSIKDVKSIVDIRNKKVIYESDEEVFSQFFDEYISKLG